MKNLILSKIREHSIDNNIACKFMNDSISYKELEKETNLMAQLIYSLVNNKKQVPIIIYYSRNIQFIKFMIAVLKCGCFYIPLERSVPIDRVKYIYNDINAQLIITDMKNNFDCNNYRVTSLEDFESSANNELVDIEIGEQDLVYVMYTSGTSGKPKGVKIMYSNLLNLVNSFYDIVYKNFKQNISVGVLASFSFDSSVKQIYCSLYYGHTLCIADDSVKLSSRKIHEFHVTYNLAICDATPSHINLMTLQKTKLISKVPYIIVGGEILRWEILHKFIEYTNHMTTFINVYGPTECCVDVAYKVIYKEDLDKHLNGIVPIGKSIENTCLIVKSEDNVIIEDCNIEGELFIAGRQVGAGYVNQIDKQAFIDSDEGLIFKTGDIAYVNCDHDIVVIGRKDTQVKINGYRIELNEIQVAIEQYLKSSCAIFCINQNKVKKIVAFICKPEFQKEDKYDLINYLKQILPAYMLPNYFFSGTHIPLTTNGKQNEKELINMFYEKFSLDKL